MCKKILVLAKEEETGRNKNESHHEISEKVKTRYGGNVKISIYRCKKETFSSENKMFKKKSKNAEIILSAIGFISGLNVERI